MTGTVIQCPGCAATYELPERPPPTYRCSCGVVMDLAQFAAAPPARAAAPPARAAAPPARPGAAPAPSAPVAPRRTCKKCGTKLGTSSRTCPACGEPCRGRLTERDDPQGMVLERKVLNGGVVGGSLAILGAVVWFVAGLAAGYVFFYPPVLAVVGVVAITRGLQRPPPPRRRT